MDTSGQIRLSSLRSDFLMKTFLRFLLPLILVTATPLPAAIVLFDLQGKAGAGLLPGNENPAVTGGTGGEIGGGISYNDVTNLLTINVGWGSVNGFTNLAGAVNNSHIHGATASSGTASFLENAGVLFNLPRVDSTANAGSISTSVTLTEPQEAELLAGRYYINVHTTANGGGEIRGNLVAVPEPGRALLAGIGGFMLALRRRRM